MPATLTSRIPLIVAGLDPGVNQALRAGMELVAERAREVVPVDEGDLREAIHVQEDDEADGVFYVVAGQGETYYGHMVEFGTNDTPAHPFLVPALESSRDEVVAMVSATLRGLV